MAYQNGSYRAEPRHEPAYPYDVQTSYPRDLTPDGYSARPANVQSQNGPEVNSMQRPRVNGYTHNRSFEHSASDLYAQNDGYYDERQMDRAAPNQFSGQGYNKAAKWPRIQQSHPRPIDTRHKPSNIAPAPRSAGPYQGTSGQNTQDDYNMPRPYQGRGDYSRTTHARHEIYTEQQGYIEHDHGENPYDASYDGHVEQPCRYDVSQKPLQHHRGHSDGFYPRNGTVPPDARRGLGPERPSYEQPYSRSNGDIGMEKKKMFEDPTSPENLSWDNPFPTFPAGKKRGNSPEKNLYGSMANVSLRDAAARTGDNGPQTSSEFSPIGDGNFSSDQNFAINDNRRQDPHGRNVRYDDASSSGTRNLKSKREDEGAYQSFRRPEPLGRRSEEPPGGSRPQPYKPYEPNSGRSKTMPSAVSDAIMDPYARRAYGQSTDLQDVPPVNGGFGQSSQFDRPSTASSLRPARPAGARSGEISRLRSEQVKTPVENGSSRTQEKAVRPPAVHQDSIADLYDSYYDISSPKQPNNAHQKDHEYPPSHEDMPNFDAIPSMHNRGATIDDHMIPRLQSPEMPAAPTQYRQEDTAMFQPGARSRQVMHSKSQPDLSNRRTPRTQQDNGFDFGIPGPMPQMNHNISQTPSNNPSIRPEYDGRQVLTNRNHRPSPEPYRSDRDQGYNDPYPQSDRGARAYNQAPQQHPNRQPPRHDRTNIAAKPVNSHGTALPDVQQIERYRSPNAQDRAPSNRPSPVMRGGPTSPPPVKPDALPAHPAPVRAGLMQSTSPSQPPKPAPVRNYNNNASPLQESGMTQPPAPSQPSNSNSLPATLTSSDLEKLRTVAKSNPADQKAQMNLAKALVQAAAALEEYVPQTDQRARGKMREKYVSEAHKTVKRLVSTGYPDAMFFLGDCYSQARLGLDKDPKEAFSLYQGAAKAGHAQAAFRVAVCCELGLEEDGGTKRDLGKAVQWYKRAATLGDTPAMYKTGVIQLKGLLGQSKDPGEAIVWLRRAAERADKDNPHALHELALWHETASDNGKSAGDEAYAKQLFVQAAELGYKFSQYRLGRACEYGLMGCPIDPRLSISWYSKAAVQEEHQSELALSGWYLTGAEGILQQSDTEAFLWARKAATAGLAKAEFAMGYFTEVGIGCPPSSEEAKRWYWRAASQNFPKARERLEELRKGGAKMKKERVSRSAMKQESECSIM